MMESKASEPQISVRIIKTGYGKVELSWKLKPGCESASVDIRGVVVPEDIAALPDAQGYGKMRDLISHGYGCYGNLNSD